MFHYVLSSCLSYSHSKVVKGHIFGKGVTRTLYNIIKQIPRSCAGTPILKKKLQYGPLFYYPFSLTFPLTSPPSLVPIQIPLHFCIRFQAQTCQQLRNDSDFLKPGFSYIFNTVCQVSTWPLGPPACDFIRFTWANYQSSANHITALRNSLLVILCWFVYFRPNFFNGFGWPATESNK